MLKIIFKIFTFNILKMFTFKYKQKIQLELLKITGAKSFKFDGIDRCDS